MNRPFRTIHNVSTGKSRVEYLTDEEIAERQARSADEAERQAKSALEEQAKKDINDYLMNFVLSRSDCPQSIKDFVSEVNLSPRLKNDLKIPNQKT